VTAYFNCVLQLDPCEKVRFFVGLASYELAPSRLVERTSLEQVLVRLVGQRLVGGELGRERCLTRSQRA
jgi:hypothetical protein